MQFGAIHPHSLPLKSHLHLRCTFRAFGLVSWLVFKEVGSNSHLEVKARTRKTALNEFKARIYWKKVSTIPMLPAHPKGAPFVSVVSVDHYKDIRPRNPETTLKRSKSS